jgi:hypothetical protein
MIFSKKIVESLSKKLLLPFTGLEQDWELEMANSERVSDFLHFYNQGNLSTEELRAIMALILASYDDFLNENNLEVDDRWGEIKEAIEKKKDIYCDLLNYWALNGTMGSENLFRITPLIRKINSY